MLYTYQPDPSRHIDLPIFRKEMPGVLAMTALLALACISVDARGFRSFRQIASPSRAMKIPKGSTAVEKAVPVSREVLTKAVKDVMASWNKGDFGTKLDDSLYDKQRLLDNMADEVPADARIRVISTQGIQILQQYLTPAASSGGKTTLTCIVNATVRTQIEYNDPENGFQRVDGTNDYVLRLKLEPAD